MDTTEKEPTRKEKEADRTVAEDSVGDQSDEMTLGDELLIREYERSERIRNLLEKQKSEEKN